MLVLPPGGGAGEDHGRLDEGGFAEGVAQRGVGLRHAPQIVSDDEVERRLFELRAGTFTSDPRRAAPGRARALGRAGLLACPAGSGSMPAPRQRGWSRSPASLGAMKAKYPS